MLVDLILDRRDGVSYSPSEFEEEVKEYCETFPSYIPVYKALLGGSEDDVKDELCRYIDNEWYGSPLIKDYINSVNWP
jgi:hypothetical protein